MRILWHVYVIGISQTCFSPKRAFQPWTLCMSFEFVIAILTLRAKGTLISEPRFSTPYEMRFFPREKGKTAFSKNNPRQRPFSLSRMGKIASRRG